MIDSIWLFALAALAALFAGVSKGGFGSGAAFASSAVLALVMPPAAALGIMLPLLMLIDVTALPSYWRRWSWPDARLLILGGLPGVVLGALLFTVANDDVMRLLIGAVALTFVFWRLAPYTPSRHIDPGWLGGVAGLVSGFTSFVSHAGGPSAAVYLLARGLDKTTYQSTTVLVFWALNVAKAVPYGFLGVFTAGTLLAGLWLAPFAIGGTFLGVWAHRIIPERLFFGVTYVMLTLTGAKLIWDALV